MDRKINPFKLFDAGADLISSAVKNTASRIRQGPSVGDRLFKSGEDAGDDGKLHLSQLRIALSIDEFTDAESATYLLALVDKRTNDEVAVHERRWSDCEPVIHMVRSMYPKLEVPAPPPRPQGRAAAIVVEERRKYVQAVLNVCAGHATISKMKEVQVLCGLVGGAPAPAGAASPSPARSDGRERASSVTSNAGTPQPTATQQRQPTPKQPVAASSTSQQQQQQQPPRRPAEAPAAGKAEDDLTTPSRQVTFASPDRHRPAEAVAPVVDERSLIDECFKLVDVDNSGFVTEDELAEFMHSLPKHVSSRAVQQCLADVGGDPEAIDAKTFRLFMTKLAQVTRVAAEDMWRGFRRRKLTQVYEAIGDTAKAEEHEIDRDKLKPLLAVLQTGGLRQLGPSALTGVEYAVPYTYAEYEDVMDVLLRVIPAHELINSMRATEAVAEGGQTLAVINRYAGKAPAAVVKQLKDMVGRYGGTSCSNCAAVQAKRDEAEQQMRLIATEKDTLADKLKAMTARHKDAEAQAAEAQRALGTKDDEIASLHEQIQKLRQEALEATAAKESLVHKVCEAEAELDLERDAKRKKRAGDDFEYATDSETDDDDAGGMLGGDEDGEAPDAAAIAANMARRVNMQFLVPAHLGSREEAPIVDRPGALVYSLEDQAAEAAAADGFTADDDGAGYRPMGFATDVYVTDGDVSEYLALRSPGSTGYRSLAWTIQGGFLSCGWSGRRAPLAIGRWVRVSVKLRWDESCFDVLFDGAPVPELSRVPFRDAAAEAAGVLDIFPRDHVAVYYANMHFFR